MKSGQEKFLDYVLSIELERKRIPGLSVAIWEKGKIVYSKAFGYANVKTKEKLTPRHRFRVASHSKMFTAIALMELVKQGKLSLDDPITKHFPFMHIGYSKTTVAQIMNHVGGIIRDGTDASYWDYQTDFPDRVQIEHLLTHTPPVMENNTIFKYSNVAYALLGMLIEKVSGEDYRDFMMKHLIGTKYDELYPCYMGDGGPYTHGHTDRLVYGDTYPFSIEVGTRAMDAAAGFCATPSGLCRFFGDFMNNKIVDRETVKRLIHPMTEVPDAGHYGLGFSSCSYDDVCWYGHGGDFPGQYSSIRFNKEQQTVVSCMINNSEISSTALMDLVIDVLNMDCSQIKEIYPAMFWGESVSVSLFQEGKSLCIVFLDDTPVNITRYAEKDKKGRWIIKDNSGDGYNGELFEIVSKDHIRIAGYNAYTRALFEKEIVPNFKA